MKATLNMIQMAVHDIDKSKEFYTNKLGFRATQDYGHGPRRWVSLILPDGCASLNLTTFHENMTPGSMKLYLATPDIHEAYKELEAKGVKLNNEVKVDSWGTWFDIDDPEGNHWVIVAS